MDIANATSGQSNARLQQVTTSAWHLLRDPRLTGGLVALVLLVLLFTLLLPQSSGVLADAEAWVTALPTWLQPWGNLLYASSFGRLGQSFWLWGPVALLMLSCAVALVDYGLPTYRRAAETPADVRWQPPLARRVEISTRLPAKPDELLGQLREKLTRTGYRLDGTKEENERAISAYRRRWAWRAVPGLYAGLLLLSLGLLVSRYALSSESITLPPFESEASRLFDGEFAVDDANVVTFTMVDGQVQALSGQLYQPALFNGALIIPTHQTPVLTVEVQDSRGQLRRLLPTRPDLTLTERLNLPLDRPSEPLYFSIPSESLIVQIIPEAVATNGTVNLQIVRRGGAEPALNETLAVGRHLSFEGLTLQIALNHTVTVLVWRDWALPLYGLGLLVTLVSALVLLVSPPWQIWLLPEVKGRGGQLYAVAESFNGSPPKMTELLRQLVATTELEPRSSEAEPEMTTETEIEPR